MDRPKLAADAMVGRLAKWLRLLGFDTLYLKDGPRWPDRDRMLLTRRTEGPRQPRLWGWAKVIRLAAETMPLQLHEAAGALGLTREDLMPFTRCGVCNRQLVSVSHAQAVQVVPPYVWATQDRFQACPGCGRTYWAATHQRRIMAVIDDLFPGEPRTLG
jgi:uncharacterized protein with PIN domain